MADSYDIADNNDTGKVDSGVKLTKFEKLQEDDASQVQNGQSGAPLEESATATDKTDEVTEEPKTEESPQEDKTEDKKEEEVEEKEEQKEEVKEKEKPKPVSISGEKIKQLVIGTPLNKAKKGSKVISRIFHITNDLTRLTWNSQRKPAAKAQIPLTQIQEVISGRNTTSFRLHNSPSLDEQCCFSLVYIESGHTNTLDLIATTPEEASVWVDGLIALTASGVSSSVSEVRQRWLRSIFDDADVNNDGTLDLKEVIQMMKKMNIGISQKVIKRKFKEADTDGNGDNKLDFDEFANLYHDLSDRPEMRKIFNLYASSDQGDYMSIDDLISFLINVQNVSEVTREYCESVIERFEPSEVGRKDKLLSLDGFIQFMLSPDNDVFVREHTTVYQDMTQPLSHYFIASSHNTYLLEDQLSGPSSVDAYISALNKGCRCVELDCWDGEDDEPVIYHGHTLTSKILFKDVIAAIKEHAFTKSPYPVILSIENHCSVKQQGVMADYMTDIFGDLLHKETRNHERGVLPSPEELKYKILIKAKKLPVEQEDKSDDEGEVSDEDEAAEIDPEEIKKVKATSPVASVSVPVGEDPPEEPPLAPPETTSNEGGEGLRKVIDSSESRKRARSNAKSRPESIVAKPTAKRKLSSKLSKCVNYVQSVHFKGFEHTPNVPFYQMSSFGESAATKSSEELAHHFIEYNKNHLSRTYPSGRRVDSSNYEPINMWNAGCQIVALNYQTSGKAMDWNIGKFKQNGSSGYILKPEIMRQDLSYFNHMERNGPHGVSPKVITIRVISGQELPKPEGGSETGEIIDPYVQIQFAGVPMDCTQFKTKVVNDNGFNPVWNESFSHVVNFPELMMVRFKVMDYDMLSKDDFIGQFTLPFNSIETGYRHVHLHNSEWEPLNNATIFIEVTTHDYIGPPAKSKEKLRDANIKKARQYPAIKTCHFSPVDSQLKTITGTLKTAIDFKEDFKFLLRLFKDSCGKPAQTSFAECIQVMFTRGTAAQLELSLEQLPIGEESVVYQIKATAPKNPTPMFTKMISSFNRLNIQISTLNKLSPMITNELEGRLTAVLNLKGDFDTAVADFPPRKADQAKSAYSYNVRTLQNEIAQIKAAVNESIDILNKVPVIVDKFPSVKIEDLPKPEAPPTETTPTTQEETTPQEKTETKTEEEKKEGEEEKEEEKEEKKEEKKEEEKEQTPAKEESEETASPSAEIEVEVTPTKEEEVTQKEETPQVEEQPKEEEKVEEKEEEPAKEKEEEVRKEETPQEEEIKPEEIKPEEEVREKESTPIKEDTPQVEETGEATPEEKQDVSVTDEWAVINADELEV